MAVKDINRIEIFTGNIDHTDNDADLILCNELRQHVNEWLENYFDDPDDVIDIQMSTARNTRTITVWYRSVANKK